MIYSTQVLSSKELNTWQKLHQVTELTFAKTDSMIVVVAMVRNQFILIGQGDSDINALSDLGVKIRKLGLLIRSDQSGTRVAVP